MGKKPARKRGARRLNVTPELTANVRHRYEHSAERLATMAADLGCCIETVRAIARREGWVRYAPPPRDLSPAARLRVRAEQLASLHPPTELGPARVRQFDDGRNRVNPISAEGEGRSAERSEDERGGVTSEEERSPPPDNSRHSASKTRVNALIATVGDLPPPGGGEERDAAGGEEGKIAGGEAPTSEQNAALHAKIAGELLQEVAGHLDDVRAHRKRMKREGYAKHELQAVARVIADLSNSLNRLKPMAPRAAEPDSGNSQDDSYDDMPADLDEFRDALARRIEALFASAPDEGDAAGAAGGDAAAAQP